MAFKKGGHPGVEFKKDNIPWNKNLHIQTNTGKTHFKKGQPSAFKNKHHTEESKEKTGKANKGRKPSEKTKKKVSEGVKNNLPSTAFKKGDPRLVGKNHWNWQDGISFEPYSSEFNERLKEKIRKRDSYRCQQCFRHQDELYTKSGKKYKLPIHHIDYNKKNNAEENLIALCRGCHQQTNFGREDWTNYFSQKVRHS